MIGPTALITVGVLVGVAIARMPVKDPGAIAGMRSRSPMRPSGSPFLNQLFFGSLSWYACALSCPLFIWLARRYPLNRGRWPVAVGVHFVALVVMVTATASAYYIFNPPGGADPVPLLVFARSRLTTDVLPFLAMIAVIHAFEYRRRERLREEEAVRLTAQLTQSRLDALTAQLQPHFLFNTLQGISTLMHRDVRAADVMLSQLSDLLRRALDRGDKRHEIRLEEELELLNAYVEISRQRFGGRLSFDATIESGLANSLVPFFILQPLVENAMEHGIARRTGTGSVTVDARRVGSWLHLRIIDDGAGDPGTQPAGTGIGLSNTRSRLRALYGDDQDLLIEQLPQNGTQVTVIIPLRGLA